MQLNIYIPKGRADILRALDRASRETGRQKSDLVLEALERYLAENSRELGRYHMGETIRWRRGDPHEGRLKGVK